MEENLDTLLKFDSLKAAEQTLTDIHRRFRDCQRANDTIGMARCRALIIKGKGRAVMISRNKKVAPAKREEKAEIAQWFTVWLQTPDIFWDWLDLRKAADDFRLRFQSNGKEHPS
jgi:hypothetical protein